MIHVAIIGAGIGAEHLRAYQALSDRFGQPVLCDLDTERARAVAGNEPSIRITDDLDAVLSDPNIDVIDVCLPPHLHFPISIKALQAGKHVICEKPLVQSLDQADALADAAEAAGKKVFPVFQYRYGPGAAKLRALMDAGLVGKPFVASLETHWNRDADYYGVPWRGTWEGESGGAVLGHAIHSHDYLCHFLGPIAEVFANLDTRVNDIEVEDCAAISFRMENGALATSCVTLGAGEDSTRLRFCFDGLTAESGNAPYSPAEDTWRFIARAPVTQAQVDEVIAKVGQAKLGFDGYLEAVADALEGRGGREVNLEEGRRSIELVTAIYQSGCDGSGVQLPLAPGSRFYNGWLPDQPTKANE